MLKCFPFKRNQPFTVHPEELTAEEFRERAWAKEASFIFRNPYSIKDNLQRNEYEYLSILESEICKPTHSDRKGT